MSTTSTGSAHGETEPRATRRRGSALVRAIYLATLEELAETSFEELGFDKIAVRAGTGKASLYRRWGGPAELVLAALTDPVVGFPPPAEPATGSLRADLLALLTEFARVLDEPHGRALRPLLTQRPRHPELYEQVFHRVVRPHQDILLACLEAAARRGTVSSGAVTKRIAAVGPRLILIEHMNTGRVPADEVAAVVDEVLLPLTTVRSV